MPKPTEYSTQTIRPHLQRIFRGEFEKLSTRQQDAVVLDVQAIMEDEAGDLDELEAREAVTVLSERIGGARNLAEYARCIVGHYTN